MFRGFAVLGLLLGLAAPVAAQRTGGTGDCDRACLTGIADAYIAALVAHTPSKAPLASNVKFTEQAQVLEVGEGLWKTTTQGPTTFKIAVADPIAGQVGMISGGKFTRSRQWGSRSRYTQRTAGARLSGRAGPAVRTRRKHRRV